MNKTWRDRMVRGACGVAGLAALLALAGCFSFQFITVDEQTALEAQVLGTFAELEGDLILVASVRGGAPPQATTDTAKAASRAALNRRYNHDDLLELKSRGCVAERADGSVTQRPCGLGAKEEDEAVQKRLAKVVEEENRDRRAIMQHVIEKSPELSEKDLPRIGKIFARMAYEEARPDDLLEAPDGTFKPKKDLMK